MRRTSNAAIILVFLAVVVGLFWYSVSPSRNSLVVKAAAKGDISTMSQLIKEGANVNWATKVHRRTALIAASRTGQREAVQYLLAIGADKNLKDASGRTALDEALSNGWTNIANLLRSTGSAP